jgi:O-antigen/teichoic acid export membrane protein
MSAFSRLGAGTERGRRMAQATALSAVGLGAPLAVLVGSVQPAISVLFGNRWLPAADIIILSAPGLLVFASMGAVIASRAIADGNVRSPTLAAVIRIAASLCLAAVLAPRLGAAGAGIALSVGYLLYSGLLFARFHDAERWRAASSVLRPLLVAAVAAAAGQALRVGDGAVELAVAIAASGTVWIALALLLTRVELLSIIRLLREHLGRAPARAPEGDARLGSLGA